MQAYLITCCKDCGECRIHDDGTCLSHCAEIEIDESTLAQLTEDELSQLAIDYECEQSELLEKHAGKQLYKKSVYVHDKSMHKHNYYVRITEWMAEAHYTANLSSPEMMDTAVEFVGLQTIGQVARLLRYHV